jgi:hypothetical protein
MEDDHNIFKNGRQNKNLLLFSLKLREKFFLGLAQLSKIFLDYFLVKNLSIKP